MADQYEPPSITDAENPQSWANGELKNAFNPLVTTSTDDASRKYAQMATDWQEGVETFLRSINRSIAEAWEGASAEAAKTAISNYANNAQQLTKPLQELADGMAQCAASVNRTRNSIPDAVIITGSSWLNPWHRHTLEQHQSEHAQEARDAFQNHYVTPFGDIDSKIPVLPAVNDPAHPLDISKPTPGTSLSGNDGGFNGGGGGGTGGGGGVDGGSGSGSGAADGSGSGAQGSGDQSQSSNYGSSGNGYSGVNSGLSSSGDAVKPSSFDPTATTPSDFAGGGPGGGGLGGGGLGGLGGGLGAGGSGGAGHSVPGTGTPLAAQNAAAAARMGAGSGAAGMTGMGGMGSKGGKGEEDGQHERPDWLVNMENTRELLGDDPRTIPGGVIGGDYQDFDLPPSSG